MGCAGVLAYNQDHARQRICNWLDGHNASAAAFDFPTKGILQYAVDKCEYWRLADSNNKPSGLLGWWPSKSVVSCGVPHTFHRQHACQVYKISVLCECKRKPNANFGLVWAALSNAVCLLCCRARLADLC